MTTKAELLAEAKELGLKGLSGLNKAELEAAIADAKSIPEQAVDAPEVVAEEAPAEEAPVAEEEPEVVRTLPAADDVKPADRGDSGFYSSSWEFAQGGNTVWTDSAE